MNKTIHEIALQAWNETASYVNEPEEWMADYISRVVELTVQTCGTVLSDDKSFITKYGPISTQVLKEAVQILEKHFEINNEQQN